MMPKPETTNDSRHDHLINFLPIIGRPKSFVKGARPDRLSLGPQVASDGSWNPIPPEVKPMGPWVKPLSPLPAEDPRPGDGGPVARPGWGFKEAVPGIGTLGSMNSSGSWGRADGSGRSGIPTSRWGGLGRSRSRGGLSQDADIAEAVVRRVASALPPRAGGRPPAGQGRPRPGPRGLGPRARGNAGRPDPLADRVALDNRRMGLRDTQGGLFGGVPHPPEPGPLHPPPGDRRLPCKPKGPRLSLLRVGIGPAESG